jgi:sortase A
LTHILLPDSPAPPTRIRRSRPRRLTLRRVLGRVGIFLVLLGLVLAGWLAWQFWGTNWVSVQRQVEVQTAVTDGWADGEDVVATAVPVLEGSSDAVLAAGIGHLPGTDGPGERGNYVLAAHRITHGEPFAQLPELRAGDLVHVETRTATYTYVLDTGGTDLVVPFTDSWVLDDFPVNPDGGTQPATGVGRRLITLVTCSELFHTDNRSVVFGHLVRRVPATDVPTVYPELSATAPSAPIDLGRGLS